MKQHTVSRITPAQMEATKKQKEQSLYKVIFDNIFETLVQDTKERIKDNNHHLTLTADNEYGKALITQVTAALDNFKTNNEVSPYLFEYFEKQHFSEDMTNSIASAIGYEIGASISKNLHVERREAGMIGNVPQSLVGFGIMAINLAQTMINSNLGRGVKETLQGIQNNPQARPLRISGLTEIEDFEKFITKNSIILETIQCHKRIEEMATGKGEIDTHFLKSEKMINDQKRDEKIQDVRNSLIENSGKITGFSSPYEKSIIMFAIDHRKKWYEEYSNDIDNLLKLLSVSKEPQAGKNEHKSYNSSSSVAENGLRGKNAEIGEEALGVTQEAEKASDNTNLALSAGSSSVPVLQPDIMSAESFAPGYSDKLDAERTAEQSPVSASADSSPSNGGHHVTSLSTSKKNSKGRNGK